MAKKVQRGPKYRQKVENYCLICGEKAQAIKVIPAKGKGSMFWCCDKGHKERTRKYKVINY